MYGLYYAFDQPQITIKRGQSIRWKWYTADFVNDILVGIDEVATASSTDPIEGGFSSGSRSRNGTNQLKLLCLMIEKNLMQWFGNC